MIPGDDGTTDIFFLKPDGTWGKIGWDEWGAFKLEGAPLKELTPGQQVVAVVVYSEEETTRKTFTYNVIPHIFMVTDDHTHQSLPTVLTDEEDAEVKALFIMREHTEQQSQRYNDLMEKEFALSEFSKEQWETFVPNFRFPIHPTDGGIHLRAAKTLASGKAGH